MLNSASKLLACCLALTVALLAEPSILPAADLSDAGVYFPELRRRGFFDLLERHCLDSLDDATLPPSRRTDLTIELSRTFAEHAKYVSGNEQQRLWRQSTQVLDDAVRGLPDNPRLVLLQAQRALVEADRLHYDRWSVETDPWDTELAAAVGGRSELAITNLRELESELTQLDTAGSRESAAGGLHSHEIRALLYELRYRLGTAWVDRAALFPDGDSARVAALIDADEILRKMAGKPQPDATIHLCAIRLAECRRLKHDIDGAEQILTRTAQQSLDPTVRDALTAEQVQLLLDQDLVSDAAQLLVTHRTAAGHLAGQLHDLKVQTLDRLRTVANDSGRSQLEADLFTQIEAAVQHAEREVGGYWFARCRHRRDTIAEDREYGRETANVIRQARSAWDAGNTRSTIDLYGTAIEQARAAGKSELVSELEFTSASIHYRLERFQEAADRFLAIESHSVRGPDAHLLAAWCMGKLYEQAPSPVRRTAYIDALVAHRERFADRTTAVEATWALARFQEQLNQVVSALKLYRQIPVTHERRTAADLGIARCFDQILERLREEQRSDADREAWETEAINELQAILDRSPAGMRLNPDAAQVAFELARIEIGRTVPDYQRADQLLQRVIDHDRNASGSAEDTAARNNRAEQLVRSATQYQLVTFAAQGRTDDATRALAAVAAGDPGQLLDVLDGLGRVAESATADTRLGVGRLQLIAAESLQPRRGELTSEQQQRLDLCLAQAWLATGQLDWAIESFESLIRKQPHNRQLLRQTAALLQQRQTAVAVTRARVHWKRLESLLPVGSREWMEVRHHLAQCTLQLNDVPGCLKLLRITRLLYPEHATPELHAKFESLERECQRYEAD